MKNTILILIAVLMVVCGLLLMVSSRSDYVAEKLFYRAMKTHQKITQNPDVAPPKMVASVENDLQRIIAKHSESEMAKRAHLTLAELYILNKKYTEAAPVLDAILKKYDQDAEMASKALFLKAMIYQEQDEWEKALKEFIILRDKYTDTPLGLQVPLYIGQYYSDEGRLTDAEEAFREALIFYQRLESRNRGKILGYAASNFVMETHLRLRQYEEAGEVLDNIIRLYPSTFTFAQQLPNIEEIFLKRLNKYGRAIELYRFIKEKTDNSQLKEQLEAKIKSLESEKKF